MPMAIYLNFVSHSKDLWLPIISGYYRRPGSFKFGLVSYCSVKLICNFMKIHRFGFRLNLLSNIDLFYLIIFF